MTLIGAAEWLHSQPPEVVVPSYFTLFTFHLGSRIIDFTSSEEHWRNRVACLTLPLEPRCFCSMPLICITISLSWSHSRCLGGCMQGEQELILGSTVTGVQFMLQPSLLVLQHLKNLLYKCSLPEHKPVLSKKCCSSMLIVSSSSAFLWLHSSVSTFCPSPQPSGVDFVCLLSVPPSNQLHGAEHPGCDSIVMNQGLPLVLSCVWAVDRYTGGLSSCVGSH